MRERPGRTPSADAAERKARTQRVRIGLTGLAFVFLLVLLAAAILSSAIVAPEHDEAGAPMSAPAINAVATGQPPREPLAELGVVPGNPAAEATTNATEPTRSLAPPPPR